MAGHKRLKVRLPPLPLSLGVGQRAIKQADQVTGFRLGCRKHAQVKLVVGDDLEGRTDTHELACRADVQRPHFAGGRLDSELAYLGQADHRRFLAG